MDKEWLTVDEASVKLGITKPTLREKLLRGEIKGKKVGREWRILKSEVNIMLGIVSDEDSYKKDIYIKELQKEVEILRIQINSFKSILNSLNEVMKI